MKFPHVVGFYIFIMVSSSVNSQNSLNNNSIKANQSRFTDSVIVGRFHVRFTDQFSQSYKSRTEVGLKWLDSLIDTETFKNKVEGLRYKHSKIKNKANRKCIAENRTSKRYQGDEIYELLINGDDGLGTPDDSKIDLFIDLDSELSGNVLGSTTCGIITSGEKYFNNNDPEVYAAHLLHEYMHVLGFNHFLNKPLFRSFFLKKNDPPYLIGRIARKSISD